MTNSDQLVYTHFQENVQKSSGLVILLGVMIWNRLPFSGAWAVGFLIGARLLMSGVTFLALGNAARK